MKPSDIENDMKKGSDLVIFKPEWLDLCLNNPAEDAIRISFANEKGESLIRNNLDIQQDTGENQMKLQDVGLKTLLAHLTGQPNFIVTPKLFVELLEGDHNGGMLLNQIIYFGKGKGDTEGWFPYSYDDWYSNLALSDYQVRKAVKKLKELGLVETKLKKVAGAPMLHYRPMWDEIVHWIMKFLNIPLSNSLIMETEESQESLDNGETQETIIKEEENLLKEYGEMIDFWKSLFPNKPQPRKSTESYRRKCYTRLDDEHYRDNWKQAMTRASMSPTLENASWFDFSYFIRNDTNYQKCLDNFMAWKDDQDAHQKASQPVQPVYEEEL